MFGTDAPAEFDTLPNIPADKKQVYGKVFRHILPVLCMICLMCYLDRTNLAFASMQLTVDLNFTPEVYGFGSGLFFLGYSLAMVPSQLALVRFGPNYWLGSIVAVWGLVAACFCMLTNTAQFYALRFLLGAAESGAFPGMWYYLTLFLPTSEITVPFAILEAAVASANVVAAPLAAGIMMLDGLYGIRGWQWLFVLEGAPTVALGIIIMMALPNSLQEAEFLAPTEKHWLSMKVSQSRSLRSSDTEAFSSRAVVLDACRNHQVWFVTAMGFLKNIASSGMLFWCPIIIRALLEGEKISADSHSPGEAASGGESHVTPSPGGDDIQARRAVLLSAVPFLCAAVLTLWLGHSSQKRNERALHLAVPYSLSAVLLASFPNIASVTVVGAFIALSIVIACVQGSNSVINSYIPAVTSSQTAPVSLALYNSVANLGGLLGPWVIGEIVQRTGVYSGVFRMLGVVMGAAALMTWHTRHWATSNPTKQPEADHDSISKMLEDSDLDM